MGGLFSKPKDPMKEARKLQEQQMERLAAIDLPELQKLMLQSPELVGLLEAEQLGDSAMEDIRMDPRLQEAQMRALAELEERGEVGLTPEDRARLSEITRETEAAEQARQKGILQSMAERGQMDSGAQLIAQLQSSAAASTDARRAGEQLAAQAAGARRQALQQAGGMAGQMGAQQFGQQSQVASARDRINQFNLGQRANVQQMNLGARQAIANQQADIANREQMYNVQLPQQQFQNELSKAGAQGNITSNLSQIAASQPQEASFGQKLGTIAGGAAGAYFGGPKGMAAGAQAGGSIGSMFEDGGIARNPADRINVKEYENNEMYQQDDSPAYQDGLEDVKDAYNKIPGAFDFSKGTLQEGLEAGGAKVYGQDTDKLAGQDMVYEQAQQTLGEQGDGLSDEDAMAALKGLGSLLGNKKEKAPAPKLNLQGGNYQMPDNVLQSVLGKQQQFDNPFRAEDGGISYASDGMGGIVEVDGVESFAGDRIDARLNEGEAVLNIPQQQRLMDMIRGEISPDELGNEDIIEGVPKNYRDELHREVDQPVKKKSARDEKIEGLEKLLKALGK